MFSGKSAELIRRVKRDRIGGKVVQLFKFRADARYSDEVHIASYDGGALEACPTMTALEIAGQLNMNADSYVIDEVQFYDDGVIELVKGLLDLGKDVLCAGLNLDFRGEPFTFRDSRLTVAELLVRADKIVKLSAVCTCKTNGHVCGAQATRTQRLVSGEAAHFASPVVVLGSTEQYEARCIAHHIVPGKPVLSMISENFFEKPILDKHVV